MSARAAESEIVGLFAVRQRRRLAELVDADLVAEHAARPIGDPSPALAVVLAAMRQAPTAAKLAAFETVVGREWAVIRLSGEPGVPHRFVGTERYSSHHEVLHAVFLLRLAELGLTVAGAR